MDYVWAAIYLAIGLLAAVCHWAKKRFVDRTICCDLLNYVQHNPKTTYKTVAAIVMAEVALALNHNGDVLTLQHFVAAFGAGYMSDSTLNEGPKQGGED